MGDPQGPACSSCFPELEHVIETMALPVPHDLGALGGNRAQRVLDALDLLVGDEDEAVLGVQGEPQEDALRGRLNSLLEALTESGPA